MKEKYFAHEIPEAKTPLGAHPVEPLDNPCGKEIEFPAGVIIFLHTEVYDVG